VYIKEYLLKDAAKILKINYSTAKTIIRIFRLEKRIVKKATTPRVQMQTNAAMEMESEVSSLNNSDDLCCSDNVGQQMQLIESQVNVLGSILRECVNNLEADNFVLAYLTQLLGKSVSKNC
jgi:hypothetical protein